MASKCQLFPVHGTVFFQSEPSGIFAKHSSQTWQEGLTSVSLWVNIVNLWLQTTGGHLLGRFWSAMRSLKIKVSCHEPSLWHAHLSGESTTGCHPKWDGVRWGRKTQKKPLVLHGSTMFYHVLSLGVLKRPLFSGGPKLPVTVYIYIKKQEGRKQNMFFGARDVGLEDQRVPSPWDWYTSIAELVSW